MSQDENQTPRTPSESERWLAFREQIVASDDPFWVVYARHVIDIWDQLSDRVGASLPPPRVAQLDEEFALWLSWSKLGHYVEIEVTYSEAQRPQYEIFWYRKRVVESPNQEEDGLFDELPLHILVPALISHLNYVEE